MMFLSKSILLKSIIYQVVYLLAKFLKISPVIKRRFYYTRFAFIIPFKYIFLCRFGDAYTVISAFTKRYYDIIKVPRNGVVLDIGSHIGTFTVRCVKKLKEGIVISIEPEPENFRILLWNILINRIQNVHALPIALGSVHRRVKLYVHEFTGHSTIFPSQKYVEVLQLTLDTLRDKLNLPRIDLIKINAEGAELQILEKGENTLKCTRALIIAAHHYPQQSHIIASFLKNMGFLAKDIQIKGNTLVIAVNRLL